MRMLLDNVLLLIFVVSATPHPPFLPLPFPSPSFPLPLPSLPLPFLFPSPSPSLLFTSPSFPLPFPFPSPSLPLAFPSPSLPLPFPFPSPPLPKIVLYVLHATLTHICKSHYTSTYTYTFTYTHLHTYTHHSRALQGLFDHKNTGKIGVQDFAVLMKYVQQWRALFERYDTDRSGSVEAGELHRAYNEMGYRVSPQFCQLVVARFDLVERRRLKLDDFIQSCVMIQKLTDSFKQRDTNRMGVITVSYDDFLSITISSKP